MVQSDALSVGEKKDLMAQAFSGLLEGRPSDRTAIIEFLKGVHSQKNFGPLDNAARTRLVNIMAQHGYVLQLDYVLLKKDFEEKLKRSQEETEAWHRLAEKRRIELETCEDELKADLVQRGGENIAKK